MYLFYIKVVSKAILPSNRHQLFKWFLEVNGSWLLAFMPSDHGKIHKLCDKILSVFLKRLSPVDNLINRDQSSPGCRVSVSGGWRFHWCLLLVVTWHRAGPCEIVVKSIRVGSISDKKSRRVAHKSHHLLLEKGRLAPAVTCWQIWRLIIMQLDCFARDKRLEVEDLKLYLHN